MSSDALDRGNLGIAVAQQGNVAIVHLRGSAGMGDAERLQERLGELTRQTGPRIVVDLGELTFVNSAGLGAFIAAFRSARDQKGALAFANPRAAVAQLLRVTHLERLIPTYDSVEAAQRAVESAAAGTGTV